MSSISLNTLFQTLEAQVGKDALAAAFVAYSGAQPAVAVKQVAPAVAAIAAGAPSPVTDAKAKMKAAREAAAARKAAAAAPAAAAAAAAAPADASDGGDSTASSQRRRGPPKLSEMTAEQRAAHDAKISKRKAEKAAEQALPASPPLATEDPTVFAEFTHAGVKYLRNMRGDLVEPVTFDWVGRFDSKTKTIDTKFPQPADLADE
jgi:hypothetical protein